MVTEEQYNHLRDIGYDLLLTIGENPEREGLLETPARFARFWRDFVNYESGRTDTTFEAITTDQMIVISGINVWSLCEHHLLPFSCKISIGYIARDKVLGLSKFARIAHKYASRLQLQERLTRDIAEEVATITRSNDVAVIAKGVHTCMVMRGIKTDANMISSVMRGAFYDKPEARAEFIGLTQG